MKKHPKLEDNQLWQDANSIAEHIYEKIDELPIEEEWNTARKFRSSANDLIFSVAQAIGSDLNPAGAQYEWNYVRRNLFSLKTMYRFAGKQKYIDIDPNIMIKIDNLMLKAEENFEMAVKQEVEREKKELAPWLEKYRIWKEINHES